MAQTFTKAFLSGSTNGRQIKVAATSSPGTTIHTAVAGTSAWDEVWLWMTNNHTSTVSVTIEFGGTTTPDDSIQFSLATKSGLALVVPGLVLNGSVVVKVWATTANVICVSGFVNQIT